MVHGQNGQNAVQHVVVDSSKEQENVVYQKQKDLTILAKNHFLKLMNVTLCPVLHLVPGLNGVHVLLLVGEETKLDLENVYHPKNLDLKVRESRNCIVRANHCKVRYRKITLIFYILTLNKNFLQQCNSNVCPVWTEWSEWTVCSVTCGGGKRTKTRECVLPDGARSSDLYCEGKSIIVEECNSNKCPGKCPCPVY